MKRLFILLLCAVLVLCIGCTKQWSEEREHLYRHDVEPGDFAFLFNEWDYEPGMSDEELGIKLLSSLKGDNIESEDIFDALGLPMETVENYGVINYSYMIGDEFDIITIKYNPDKGVVDLHPEIYSIEDMVEAEDIFMLWSNGAKTIDGEEYKMNKRFNIREKEISFINEEITSKEVQRALGAPHYYVESRENGVENMSGNAFVYELKNGNTFKIIYFRQGYILRAWVEDTDGKELDRIIDRDVERYYEDK